MAKNKELTQQEMDEINKTLKDVESYGTEEALAWFRQAYWAYQSSKKWLLLDLEELRNEVLQHLTMPILPLRLAQLLKVCRFCRIPYDVQVGYTREDQTIFLFRFGEEFAHCYCLERHNKQMGVRHDRS